MRLADVLEGLGALCLIVAAAHVAAALAWATIAVALFLKALELEARGE
jgi:hypothetical protein